MHRQWEIGIFVEYVWEGVGGWDVWGGCFTQNVHLNVEFFPPSCGVLFAKGGGDGGVAV